MRGGEVTGVPGIGQKSEHVGPLKKVLPVPHLCPFSTVHWRHANPLASYCPRSSLSEGLFWPQECSRAGQGVSSLGVAPNECGVGE